MFFDYIFKNKTPMFDKLVTFGFVFSNEVFVYSQKIVDNQFNFIIQIFSNGEIHTKVIDIQTEDEYTLHLLEGVEGRFVGKVRSACLNILQTIADNCFETKIFKSKYADEIIKYVKRTYNDDLEYLWPKFPKNAIVRRADNKKWYIALLTIKKNKIGLEGDQEIEIIDLRIKPEELNNIIDGEKYFLGYHMNKKHWITICLDGSIELPEICKRIDDSYLLAKDD